MSNICQSCGQVLPQKKIEERGLVLDTELMLVWKNGKLIHLSRTQYLLLKHLMINKNIVITRQQLLDVIWRPGLVDIQTRAVDVQIGYLRSKIGKEYIETRTGFGYMFLDL